MAESSIKNLFTCTTRHCDNVDKNKVSNEYATQYKNLKTIKARQTKPITEICWLSCS